MLRPEVKQALDKIIYQMDLVKGTLGLLEQRITKNEQHLQGVMNFIRQEDLNYKPTVAKVVVEEAGSPEKSEHLYHPAQYKMMEPPLEDDAHRPLHSAVTGSVRDQEYDLEELRRKLEKRMEYQLVSNIQTDSNRQRRQDEADAVECPSYNSTPIITAQSGADESARSN